MAATVRKDETDTLYLDDPQAVAFVEAVGKYNCRHTFHINQDRVDHFVERMVALRKSPANALIVIVNVDATPWNQDIADALMPGTDWQSFRDQGQVPFARGIVDRHSMENIITRIDPEMAFRMRSYPGVCVVVFDHGVIQTFRSNGVAI